DLTRVWISSEPAPHPVWSADGRFIIFAQITRFIAGIGVSDPTYQYSVLNVDHNRVETLSPDARWNASPYIPDDTSRFVSPDHKRFAIRWRNNQDGTLGLDLLDPDGAHRLTLIHDAYWIESVSWSPDGQRVAVIWSEARSSQGKHKLTWLNSDGT